MTATIALFPTPDHDPCVVEWALDMMRRGYRIETRELSNGQLTNVAYPSSGNTARLKRPHHRRQYGHGVTPTGGPDGPDAA